MTSDDRFERLLADVLVDVAPMREPERLVPEILRAARRERRRPRWLALIKEPPMRTHARVAVGSPIVRLAFVLLLTALTAVLAAGAVVTGATLLPGTTIVVAQDGSGTVRTISEAVAMAGDGHTIIVKPGTYHESIVISDDITLRGDGDRGAVVLEFSDTDEATWPVDLAPTYSETDQVSYGIVLDHTNARIENITVRGRIAVLGEKVVGGLVIDGGSPVVDSIDIILDGEPYFDGGWLNRSSFQITGGSSPTILGSAWDGLSRIAGPLASTPTFEGNTITAQRITIWGGGHTVTIRDNRLLDGASIVLADPTVSTIVEGNDIDGSIGGYAGDGTVIRSNTIRGGGEPADGRDGSAIGITGSGSAIVDHNEIIDSPLGIDISGSGATPRISDNTIRGSTTTAILVERGTAPTITGNTIEQNGTGIAVRGVTPSPVVTDNVFCGNGTDLTTPDASSLTLDGNTICEPASSGMP